MVGSQPMNSADQPSSRKIVVNASIMPLYLGVDECCWVRRVLTTSWGNVTAAAAMLAEVNRSALENSVINE